MSERISIASIPIDVLTIEQLHSMVHEAIVDKRNTLVVYANAHLVQLAHYEQNWLVDFYQNAQIVICDGAGIQVGARLTRQRVPDKIPYNTWFWSFLSFLRTNSHSIFLVGGSQEVIDETVFRFKASEPGLRIAGYHNGYFNQAIGSPENSSIIDTINASAADVLLVGLGMPKQEMWIRDNRHRVNAPVIMTCGGAFDFFSGRHPVAPKLMRLAGMEWLFRLMREPSRMMHRYTIGNLRYLWLVFQQSLGIKIKR